jgi:hypothetical protein
MRREPAALRMLYRTDAVSGGLFSHNEGKASAPASLHL